MKVFARFLDRACDALGLAFIAASAIGLYVFGLIVFIVFLRAGFRALFGA